MCVLYLTGHTHKRGTLFALDYEEDGKDPLTGADGRRVPNLLGPVYAAWVSRRRLAAWRANPQGIP